MRNMFIIEYAIYLFSMVDTVSTKGYLEKGRHSTIWVIYVVLLFFQLVVIHIDRYRKSRCFNIKKVFFVMLPIFITYLFALSAEYTSRNVVLSMLTFIVASYFNGRLISEYRCIKNFLIVSYFLPLIYIIIHNLTNNYLLSVLLHNLNICTYFSMVYKSRFRFDFGFNNPNAIGNILSYLICISFLLRNYYITIKQKLIRLIIVVGDVFCLSMLLITGCRAGIMIILIFSCTYAYLCFMQNRYLSSITVLLIKISCILVTIIFGVFSFNYFSNYYMHSGRQYAFSNLKFLNNFRRKLFGIGLIEESFTQLRIDGNRGDFLDNYYIYIIVTTGIIGACFIMFSIIMIGKGIYKHITQEKIYVYVFSYYIALLFYGLVESAVLNFSFLTSGIYFALFIALFDSEVVMQRTRGCLNTMGKYVR